MYLSVFFTWVGQLDVGRFQHVLGLAARSETVSRRYAGHQVSHFDCVAQARWHWGNSDYTDQAFRLSIGGIRGRIYVTGLLSLLIDCPHVALFLPSSTCETTLDTSAACAEKFPRNSHSWSVERSQWYLKPLCRSDSREHHLFMSHLRLDKTESSMSYQEFLQHVQQQLAK